MKAGSAKITNYATFCKLRGAFNQGLFRTVFLIKRHQSAANGTKNNRMAQGIDCLDMQITTLHNEIVRALDEIFHATTTSPRVNRDLIESNAHNLVSEIIA